MAATMHDLRLSLRDKMKTISELEMKINELKSELFRKDSQIYEYEMQLKNKDEIINSKDAIIKEKDLIISKLENKFKNSKTIDNHVEPTSLEKETAVVIRAITPIPNDKNKNNEQTVTLALPNKKQIQLNNNNHMQKPPLQNQQTNQNLSKTKRTAISAEPAQLNKKSKDFKTYLKEYDKSEE